MKILSNNQVTGDMVGLKVSRKNHIADTVQQTDKSDPMAKSFADMFNNAIGEVNNLEIRSTELTNQMAIDPDSVNIHDVQIAAEQAEMAVMFTKGIVDRVIRAYKEMTSLR
jgi:flagellar hook-basal body complex protein FliE